MASSTTYGDWMRRIPGGIRNIGMPLTIAGFGVAVLALLVSTFNPLAGIAVAAAGVGAIAVLAVRDRRHRNVVDRMTERRAMREARRTGRGLYRSGFLGVVDGGETSLPGVLSRVGLVDAVDGLGRPFCLIRHGHTGEYALPIACHPQGAGLADDDVEDAYVASWARLMESLAVEQGVTQMSVTVDTSPDSGVRFRRVLGGHMVTDAPDLAARAMAQVMDLYATGGARSDVTLTLTFRYMDSHGRFLEPEEAARRISLLLPDVRRRIMEAGGGDAVPLDVDQVARMVRACYDPAAQETLEETDEPPIVAWEDAGPVAAAAEWDWYRHDSGVSRTWEMCDPPRSNVTSSNLARLLEPLPDCDRKRVTVVFHMLSPDRTAFLVEQNRVKASAQVGQEKRATMGSMSQVGKADRQAAETNRGAVMVFFGLLVTATVAAGGGEAARLEAASRAVESAAGGAKIDLRPCYAAQDTGFAASLPLGVNLQTYTPPSLIGSLLK